MAAPLRIWFLLTHLFPLYVLVLVADAKRRANKYAVHPKFEWVFISDDGRQVEASSGIYMDCDVLIDAARDLHYAFVLAGDEQAWAHTRRICPWNITARCASTVPSS